ncbi:MAG: toll/interleukin-1 receptor domain-containing protein [Chloroflexi bacterium]|nr:toll/interleukin-1 receptor domain-containing protein [Chloroflexota bacterium]
MAYKVFISHSTADMELVQQLKNWLETNGIEAYVAQDDLRPGTPHLSTKVQQAIQECDCFLALLTVNGDRSKWVDQEIGIAGATQPPRLIVPIVENGVQPVGMLEHREYIPFDPMNPQDAINRAVWYLYNQRLSKDAQDKARGTVLFTLGMLALAAVASSGKNVKPGPFTTRRTGRSPGR